MTKDPYEVLGLKRGASEGQIKTAYRELVKKYHPDKYQNNPLADLAEEKLREVNEAYETLMRQYSVSGGSNYGTNYSGSGFGGTSASGSGYAGNQTYSSSSGYYEIRSAIERGELARADQLLINHPSRDAEWYFLSGVLSYKKGYVDDGLINVRQAMQMNPSNYEYSQVYQQMTQNGGIYRTSGNYKGYNSNICLDCIECYCLTSLCSPCW